MEWIQRVGRELREARIAASPNRAAFVREHKLSPTTIKAIEAERYVNTRSLERMAKALGLRIEAICVAASSGPVQFLQGPMKPHEQPPGAESVKGGTSVEHQLSVDSRQGEPMMPLGDRLRRDLHALVDLIEDEKHLWEAIDGLRSIVDRRRLRPRRSKEAVP
jgi:DNA-binding XRE family transcriptional regulator